MKTLILLAVAATGLAAVPATANHHAQTRCVRWSHGHCVVQQRWNHGTWRSAYVHRRLMERRAERRDERNMDRAERRDERRAAYRVGYRFRPSYAYTPYASIPSNYVSQYNLNPDNRYVYRNNYIYQVNPRTNVVERVLNALAR